MDVLTQKHRLPPRQRIKLLGKLKVPSTAAWLIPALAPKSKSADFPSSMKKTTISSSERVTPTSDLVPDQSEEASPPLPDSPPVQFPNAAKKYNHRQKGQHKPATGPKPTALQKPELTPFPQLTRKASTTYAQVTMRQNTPNNEMVLNCLKKYNLQNVANTFKRVRRMLSLR